ncbi:MAG: transposase, partial [Magnetococcales bacterium]|nr:transposase [Magnetococcales bacterium]
KNGRLKNCGAIGRKVGAVLKKYRMQRFLEVKIDQETFSYHRNEERIAEETALDGIYVLRSSVPKENMDTTEIVRAYKSLTKVERAFRSIKTGLDVRPIFHHLADRVRAHVFLCMLAYYVEWEMRQRLAPLLFSEEGETEIQDDPVAPKKPSKESERKTSERCSRSSLPLHSFKTLMRELATQVKNYCSILPEAETSVVFARFTQPTLTQKEAYKLLQLP